MIIILDKIKIKHSNISLIEQAPNRKIHLGSYWCRVVFAFWSYYIVRMILSD